MAKSARRRDFEQENGISIQTPEVDTEHIHTDGSSLFAFGEQPDYAPEPDDLPPAMPEIVTTDSIDYPKHVIDALKKVVIALNTAGQIAGLKEHRKTPNNRFQTRYDSQPGNSPDSMSDWMDGKKIGLMVGVGLETYKKPEAEKTPDEKRREAEGRKILDTLNDTDTRIAFGEPQQEVEASRERFAALLKQELQPGAQHKIDLGDRTVSKKVDAEYRNSLHEDPDEGMFFLSKLRLRSR
ncbi:hypothetical protein EPN95_03830 [Patescibacteria group bacterium]|nr:MAG: hypothetical protein EPN95_03830 [Patescibacteria group bacterium]